MGADIPGRLNLYRMLDSNLPGTGQQEQNIAVSQDSDRMSWPRFQILSHSKYTDSLNLPYVSIN